MSVEKMATTKILETSPDFKSSEDLFTNSEINLSLKCRGCFAGEPTMHFLFTVFDQTLRLADILLQTTGYKADQDDGFPPYLCTKCTTTLIDFFNFKVTFQKTELYIKTLLGQVVSDSIKEAPGEAFDKNNQIKNACDNAYKTEEIEIEDGEHSIPETYEDANDVDYLAGDDNSNQNTIEDEDDKENEKIKVETVVLVEDWLSEDVKPRTTCCERCNILFKDPDVCDTHLAKMHGINPFEKFSIYKQLWFDREYARKIMWKRIKIFESSQKQEDLIMHSNAELSEVHGKYCRICDEHIIPAEDFADHWDLHKINICGVCGSKFVRKCDLNTHMRTVHKQERDFICEICQKAFKTISDLKRHEKQHTHPFAHVCEHCGRRFTHRSSLRTHIQLKHIGNRDFVCPLCGLAFPLKATLEKHLIRHNKDRPPSFFCDLCSAPFRDAYSMRRHRLIKHTNDFVRPSCSICNKSYSTTANLTKHTKRHHSGVPYERKKRKKKMWQCGSDSEEDGVRVEPEFGKKTEQKQIERYDDTEEDLESSESESH